MMGSVGDGQGEGGSSLMKDKSGYLQISTSARLSGDEDGTKLSGLSRSEVESWTLRRKQTKKKDVSVQKNSSFFQPTSQKVFFTGALPGCCGVGSAGRQGHLQSWRLGSE